MFSENKRPTPSLHQLLSHSSACSTVTMHCTVLSALLLHSTKVMGDSWWDTAGAACIFSWPSSALVGYLLGLYVWSLHVFTWVFSTKNHFFKIKTCSIKQITPVLSQTKKWDMSTWKDVADVRERFPSPACVFSVSQLPVCVCVCHTGRWITFF